MQKRTLKDWIIATRPWSFTASSIPVLAITAYLFYVCRAEGVVGNWWNAVLAFPMMVIFQAAGNLISDYYDHLYLVDLEGSLNGVRHIQSGKFTPAEVHHFGLALLGVAAVFGAGILWCSNWHYAWLGLLGVVLAAFYPWIKYHAMGDVDIALCYAFLPAIGISLIVLGTLRMEVLWLCLPFGLLTVAILHANNTRDICNDSRAGITTLPILIGGHASKWIYIAEVILPYVLIALFVLLDQLHAWVFITYLTLPLAIKNVYTMYMAEPQADAPIATLDQQTAALQLIFGLLFTVSFVLMTLLT